MSTLPQCRLLAHSDSPHLSQVHTGFKLLRQAGRIGLQYTFADCRWRNQLFLRKQPPLGGMYALLNDQHLLYYDVRDGADFDEMALATADVYFKRSYSLAQTPQAWQTKVKPLGLNYEIYPDKPDWDDVRQLLAQPSLSRYTLRHLARLLSQASKYPLLFVPTLSNIQALPDPDNEPRVLFMMHAWDPEEVADLPEAIRHDRHVVNQMRAECVRALRQTFGERFYGGFAHSAYACQHYPDALLPEHGVSDKASYLQILKNHPICIATTGLHGSVGWKFGEYVAFSRAIVSEKLLFPPPQGFAAGSHYLEFTSPDECVAAVSRLMTDTVLRQQLMQNNHAYYRQHLRPDKLVGHTLAQVPGGEHVF